ncbi:MAG: hypothetical protein NC313_07975 [Butyrivibrio sp.]|nr:hypothetical protein [Butyrivibrio sp.]
MVSAIVSNGNKRSGSILDIYEELKEYVTNYKINLYDCQEHDTFNEYRTGLRQVFETVRYSKDKERLKKVMEENKEAYSNIDSETKDMLEVVANIKIPEKFKIDENGEEKYNMCKAFEDMRLEGYEEGVEKGIHILIQTCHELGATKEIIIQKCVEKFGITVENAGKYVEEYCV